VIPIGAPIDTPEAPGDRILTTLQVRRLTESSPPLKTSTSPAESGPVAIDLDALTEPFQNAQ
jgi:hypothetical protein